MKVASGKKTIKIARSAAAVCIALLTFAGGAFFLLLNSHYLYSLAAATATPQNSRAAVDSETAALISADVILYIRGGSNMKYASSFSSEELSHLADVRHKVGLFQASFYFLVAAMAVAFLAILAIDKDLGKFVVILGQALFASGAISVAISAILFLLSSVNFDASFTVFHKILFSSSQWQFPSYYLLVNLFTADFFASFARAVVVAGFVGGLVLILVSLVMGKFYNPKAASISA